ncbi:MAG TPA: hypothetical protein VI959_05090 [Alphaproteobacteria bacterium]|nr:hypothetical protein [Alphaproteobacteria bacterium]
MKKLYLIAMASLSFASSQASMDHYEANSNYVDSCLSDEQRNMLNKEFPYIVNQLGHSSEFTEKLDILHKELLELNNLCRAHHNPMDEDNEEKSLILEEHATMDEDNEERSLSMEEHDTMDEENSHGE